jgi:L-ribulose-5-phosphate 4-epimerase
MLTPEEIRDDYELNTGRVIVETFEQGNLDPMATPAVLVRKHGPFTWGKNAMKAGENAAVLEEVAHMASIAHRLNVNVEKRAPCPSWTSTTSASTAPTPTTDRGITLDG